MKTVAGCLLLVVLMQSAVLWGQHCQMAEAIKDRNFFERQFNTSLAEASSIVRERDELRTEVERLEKLCVK